MPFAVGISGIGDKQRSVLRKYGIKKYEDLYKKGTKYKWYKPLELFLKIHDGQPIKPDDQETLLTSLIIIIHYYSYDSNLITGAHYLDLKRFVASQHDEILGLTKIDGVSDKLAICLYRAGYKKVNEIFTTASMDVLIDSVPTMYNKIIQSWTYGVRESNQIYVALVVMYALNCDGTIQVGPPNVTFPGG